MSAGIAGFHRLPSGRAQRVERDRAHVVPAHQVGPEHGAVHAGADDPGDPVGADRETYQRTAKAIEGYLVQFLDTLNV